MSSQKSVPALQIDLQPSRRLLTFILISHGGALALLMVLPVDLWLRILVAIIVLASLFFCWRDYGHGFKRLHWDSGNLWWLTDRADNTLAVQLAPASYVHPLVIVLRFREKNRAHNLILLSDSADRSLLRRLRVRLKQTL